MMNQQTQKLCIPFVKKEHTVKKQGAQTSLDSRCSAQTKVNVRDGNISTKVELSEDWKAYAKDVREQNRLS